MTEQRLDDLRELEDSMSYDGELFSGWDIVNMLKLEVSLPQTEADPVDNDEMVKFFNFLLHIQTNAEFKKLSKPDRIKMLATAAYFLSR